MQTVGPHREKEMPCEAGRLNTKHNGSKLGSEIEKWYQDEWSGMAANTSESGTAHVYFVLTVVVLLVILVLCIAV